MSGAGADEARETSFVSSGGRRIDARLHPPRRAPRGAVVVAHPHPRHGGHMDHPVVVLAAARAAAAGLWALRFDFGGVRASEGRREDRASHMEDFRRALADARRRAPAGPLLAGGFSYGARAAAHVESRRPHDAPEVAGLLLLAPATRVPRTPRDFGHLLLGRPLDHGGPDAEVLADLRALRLPVRVIVGERDVVCPEGDLDAGLPATASREVLPGLNHFFSRAVGAGATEEAALAAALDRALAALLGDVSPAPPG